MIHAIANKMPKNNMYATLPLRALSQQSLFIVSEKYQIYSPISINLERFQVKGQKSWQMTHTAQYIKSCATFPYIVSSTPVMIAV